MTSMIRRSTRRDAEGAASRLTAADRDTLWLLARLPLLWAGALAQLAGHTGPASSYRQLQRLRADGLVATLRPPQGAGSAPRLYYPTERGLAAAGAGLHLAALARHLRVTERDIAARLPGLPPLLAAYRLLATLAASRPGRPVLQEWEQPWRWRYPSPTGKTLLRVELPAYAELRWDGGPVESCLLVPDLGVTPLRVYRAALSRLLVLRGASGLELPLVIAVPSERRAEA